MSRRKLTPAAQRPLTAISGPGEMIKFGKRPPPPTPVAPVLSSVTISPDGNQTIGAVFTCNWTISIGYPYPTAAYQWMADAVDIVGQTAQTFDSTGRSDGEVITCKVTVTNSEGADGPNTSSNSATLQEVVLNPPVNTVPPVISGNTVEGSVLTVTDNGTWTNSPQSFAYQWRKDTVDIPAETSTTYTTVNGDVGSAIDCMVTATNADGDGTADSNDITVTAIPASDRATELLSSETDGLAIAFVDDSMLVKTAGAGTSTDILTGGVVPQSTTPQKIIRGANGLLGYQKNNAVKSTINCDTTLSDWSAVAGGDFTGANRDLSQSEGVEVNCPNAGNDGVAVPQFMDLEIGEQFLIEFEAKSTNITTLNAYITGGTSTLNDDFVIGTDWTTCSYVATAQAAFTTSTLNLRAKSGQPAGSFFIRNWRLVKLPCVDTSFMSTPTFNSAATQHTWSLPIDHDLSNNSLGVLNEPTATNLQVVSTPDSAGSGWGSPLGMTEGAADGPDGVNYPAIHWIESSSNEAHRHRATSQPSITGQVTYAAIAKRHGAASRDLRIARASVPANMGFFELGGTGQHRATDGAVATRNTHLGDGWYYCEMDCEAVTASASLIDLHMSPDWSTSTVTYLGDGASGIDVWWFGVVSGASDEASAVLPGPTTSPIITAGSQVTREGDRYTMTWADLSAPWYPLGGAGKAYTFYDFRNQGTGQGGTFTSEIAEGGNINWKQSRDAGGTLTRLNDTSAGDIGPIFGVDQDLKWAWARNNGPVTASAYDGTPGATPTPSGNALGTGTTLFINSTHTGVIAGKNHIKELMFLPRAMNQTELNTLTTP